MMVLTVLQIPLRESGQELTTNRRRNEVHYISISSIVYVNMFCSWRLETLYRTSTHKCSLPLPAGGCASTTSTDSNHFPCTKSLLSVDSLLCLTTSKAELLCVISKTTYNLRSYYKMGTSAILLLLRRHDGRTYLHDHWVAILIWIF